MSCPVLSALSSAVDAVQQLKVPSGLGAEPVLAEQVQSLAGAVARLQQELAVRMAALEREGPPACDVRGEATRAGLDRRRAGLLRRLGGFATQHASVGEAWRSGQATLEQVDILRVGADKLPLPQREELVSMVLPLLGGLDEKSTRQVVEVAVDQLAPADPDLAELGEHAARRLGWSQVPGGGLAFEGYLPVGEASAFTCAIDALVESLRVAGDGLTVGQRRADGLIALVAAAGQHGLPSGGGLPAALTLTVSLSEAHRVALRDPARFATDLLVRPRGESTAGGQQVGDAMVRFGVCCAAITPVLVERDARGPGQQPGAGSLLDRIGRTPVQPLAVGRSVRLATAAQRQALGIRDGGCAIPGCGIPAAYTQPHHVVGWAVGGATDLDALVSLCWVHHRLTELGRFRFVTRRPEEPAPPGALEHPLWWIIPPMPKAPPVAEFEAARE